MLPTRTTLLLLIHGLVLWLAGVAYEVAHPVLAGWVPAIASWPPLDTSTLRWLVFGFDGSVLLLFLLDALLARRVLALGVRRERPAGRRGQGVVGGPHDRRIRRRRAHRCGGAARREAFRASPAW